jgi:signal transduction histidine kinase
MAIGGLPSVSLGLATLATTMHKRPGAPWSVVLTVMLAAQLPMVFSLVSFPLLRRLGVVAPGATVASRWSWVLYFASFFMTAVAGYAVFDVLTGVLVGRATDRFAQVIWYMGLPPIALSMLAWGERDAAFRADIAREEAELAEQIDQLFQSREALALARARRVHDVVAGLVERVVDRVEAIAHELGANDPPATEVLAARERELLDLAESELRGLSHAMHPSIVYLGLLPAMRFLAAHHAGDLELELVLPDEVDGLDEALVLAAYRMVEAALDNVRRHARATRVSITVARAGNELAIEVSDDGVGFEPQVRAWGVGFAVIESRAALAGGHWELETAPGAGTRVRLVLPV